MKYCIFSVEQGKVLSMVIKVYLLLIRVECMFLSNTLILFDGRGVFTLLPKVQLHVSALDNSHLQVVHESLECSDTRFNPYPVYLGDRAV